MRWKSKQDMTLLLVPNKNVDRYLNKSALFTAPCGWEIRQTYNSDRIPKQLTEVFCLDSGTSCDANPRYQVKSFLHITCHFNLTVHYQK